MIDANKSSQPQPPHQLRINTSNTGHATAARWHTSFVVAAHGPRAATHTAAVVVGWGFRLFLLVGGGGVDSSRESRLNKSAHARRRKKKATWKPPTPEVDLMVTTEKCFQFLKIASTKKGNCHRAQRITCPKMGAALHRLCRPGRRRDCSLSKLQAWM